MIAHKLRNVYLKQDVERCMKETGAIHAARDRKGVEKSYGK